MVKRPKYRTDLTCTQWQILERFFAQAIATRPSAHVGSPIGNRRNPLRGTYRLPNRTFRHGRRSILLPLAGGSKRLEESLDHS